MASKQLVLIVLSVLAMFSFSSCSEKNRSETSGIDVSGEWQLVSVKDEGISVYVAFKAGGMFELFQKIGDGRYRLYTGAYTVVGNVIDGVYSDGNFWASSYVVELSDDKMIFSAQKGSDAEESVYQKISIPQSVRDEAVRVRSFPHEDLVCPL